MSKMEMHIGKLEKIQIPDGVTTEEKAKEICKSRYGITELWTYYDDWTECLQSESCGGFVVVGGTLYHVISDEEITDGDIFNANENEDGTISYTLSYYNGGCSFSEAIEIAIERMRKQNE